MIWLTWRQFRTQAVVALAALAAFAAVLTVARLQLADLYDSSGLAGCDTDCGRLADAFLSQARQGLTGNLYNVGIGVVYVAPAIIGVFWGAPLIARELEAGTHRLVWNQSVTRGRWLAVKLFGVGLASVATAGLLSLMVTWSASTIDRVGTHRMTPDVFGARGIAPIGYAAFAFALGVTVGVLVRRTVAAMAITLAIVVAAQIVMPLWVRPHLVTPVSINQALDTANIRQMGMSENGGRMTVEGEVNLPGAWILSNETITTAGKVFTGPANTAACNRDGSPKECFDWLATLHLRQSLTYQPASRFWDLQWRETGIFLALAALLAGFGVWWVRRRLT
jgi:hypothetical protein